MTKTTDDINWEEPPVQRFGRGTPDWKAELDPLRAFPQRWALIFTSNKPGPASSRAQGIRGRSKDHHTLEGEWEAVSRKMVHNQTGPPVNKWGCWARYMGPKTP